MTSTRFTHLEDFRRLLLSRQNVDGGWGYYPGKSSRLEPTCWAVLALDRGDRSVRAGSPLAAWPVSDGLLLERHGGTPNYAFHALALLVLRAHGVEHAAGNARLLDALGQARGTGLEPSRINRQDNTIEAWSWTEGTFSWVEPTAWGLLALKKWTASSPTVPAARIEAAERLLFDRACVTGGWNYGNSNMLGRELKPYVPTTAASLLAMQDKPAHASVRRAADYLEREATSESSGVALGLASIALRVLGRPTTHVRLAIENQLKITIALGNNMALAIALLALTMEYEGRIDVAFAL